MTIILLNSNNKNYLSIIFTITLLSLPLKIHSQTMHKNSSAEELFNNCVNYYRKINSNLEKMLPRLNEININFIIKIYLSKLKHLKRKLSSEISRINDKLDKKNYDEAQISHDINELFEDVKYYEEKYNSTISAYYRFEKLKKSLSKFFKVFFISLFVGIAIFAIFIFIITIIVIKKQKKYYELKEEVTFEQGKEVEIKRTSDIKNDKNNIGSFRNLIKRDFKLVFPKLYKNKSNH